MPTRSPLPMQALLALFPAFFCSCMVLDYGPDTVGNGVSATEARSLPAFDRVRLEAPVHVVVKTGQSYAAYVTTDANLTSSLATDAAGGTLTIGLPYSISPTVEPQITIVAPSLRALVHNGNGTVEVDEGGDFPDLDLTLNGSGEILFSGTASRLAATVNGSGIIDMEGFAASLTATLRGEGAIHAENLLTESAQVDLSGSGYVFLDLDYGSDLELSLSGSGKIEWWGSPARLDYHLTGEGQVAEHRGLPKRAALAKGAPEAGFLAKSAAGYSETPARPKRVITFAEASR